MYTCVTICHNSDPFLSGARSSSSVRSSTRTCSSASSSGGYASSSMAVVLGLVGGQELSVALVGVDVVAETYTYRVYI